MLVKHNLNRKKLIITNKWNMKMGIFVNIVAMLLREKMITEKINTLYVFLSRKIFLKFERLHKKMSTANLYVQPVTAINT